MVVEGTEVETAAVVVCGNGGGARAERSAALGSGAGEDGKGANAGRQGWWRGFLVTTANAGPNGAASRIAPSVHSGHTFHIERWMGDGS